MAHLVTDHQSGDPFDDLAAEYDRRFTHTELGRRYRGAVWRWLDRAFHRGDRVLELNCGTGEDAVHLARKGVLVHATDRSQAMLDETRRKVSEAGVGGLVTLERVSLTADATPRVPTLDRYMPEAVFDGAVSSFGGLNLVADVGPVATGLARILRPGARVVLSVMGPLVPWEWGWYLARLRPRDAFRRVRSGGAPWRGRRVFYPSVAALRRAFGSKFECRGVGAIGVFLPPPYASAWAARHPALVARLDAVERRCERWWPLSRLADHYIMEFERSGSD